MKFLKRSNQPEFNDAITAESLDSLRTKIGLAQDQLNALRSEARELFNSKASGEISDYEYNPKADALSIEIQACKTRLELLEVRLDKVVNGLATKALNAADDIDR